MSGGFYRYRCKYFYTHNCENWVNINGGVCTVCIAQGRDDDIPVIASLTHAIQASLSVNGSMKHQYGHDRQIQVGNTQAATSAMPRLMDFSVTDPMPFVINFSA